MYRAIENIHYELIPSDNPEENWHVRILVGPYTETVIQFDTLKVSKKSLKYSFSVVNSPLFGLKPDEPELQKAASEILSGILYNIEKDGHKGIKTSESN